MPKHYLALTIGPIYETMKYCKKTRELWVGSYFFSYFMRTLIGMLDDEIKLIIPYVPDNKDEKKSMLEKYKEEGIFHDRFIMSSKKNKEELKELIENNIDATLEKIILDLDIEDGHYDALKKYLQYSYIIGTEEELTSEVNKENIIFAIDAILDSMELQYSFDSDNSTKVCTLDQKDSKKKIHGLVTPLAEIQYRPRELKEIVKSSNNNNEFIFKSIPQIAISDIAQKITDDKSDENKKYNEALEQLQKDEKKFSMTRKIKDDNNIEKEVDIYDYFYTNIHKHKDFKPHHKYYAVIYADGDKMGSTIRNIYKGKNKDKDIEQFSKNIYEYISHDELNGGKTSLYKVFDTFGGMLIFAGGDDILAFTPIFGADDRTVFDLLEELSTRFTVHMGDEVSLSFGLNINYYKSPMIEAINSAYDLLLRAKDNNTDEKSGSVALSLTKHSGQSFDATFLLEDTKNIKNTKYAQYKNLFKKELEEDNNFSLPHSIQYSLKNSEYLICDMYKNNSVEVAHKRLDALFKNSIKDESHSSQATTALDSLKEYIKVLQPKNKEDFEKLITQLAIIKFLRGDK